MKKNKGNNPQKNDSETASVQSNGGDIAIGNSTIDKRSSNIFIETPKAQASKDTKPSLFFLLTSTIVSTLLGLVSNIIASYIQEKYQILTDEKRVFIVCGIFIFSIIVTVLIGLKSEK
jgi:hypothetical protein